MATVNGEVVVLGRLEDWEYQLSGCLRGVGGRLELNLSPNEVVLLEDSGDDPEAMFTALLCGALLQNSASVKMNSMAYAPSGDGGAIFCASLS